MRPRHLLASIVTLGVLSVTLLPQAAAARDLARPSCAAKRSVTVKSTSALRVYRQGQDLLGCLRRSGRDVTLYRAPRDGNPYVEAGFSAVKVRGTVVAWRTSYREVSCARFSMCPPGGPPSDETVESTDLGTRRDVDRELRLTGAPSAYAVTTTGKLAALVGTSLVGSDGPGQLQRTLDTGAIDGRTLRAEISVVSWVRDGVERFARLR